MRAANPEPQGIRAQRAGSTPFGPAHAGARPANLRSASGFTLVELIIVLVLLTVLSVIALPRLFTDELRVAPLAERMAAEIRYAQALAMTHGEAYQFRVGGGTFWITRNGSGCASGGANVGLSDGNASGSYQGLSVSGSSCISFSSLFGSPNGAHTIQVSGNGASATVRVASETGYVTVQA